MKRIFLTLPALMALAAAGLLAQAPPAPPVPPAPSALPLPARPPGAVIRLQAIPGGSYLGIGIADMNAERAKALKLPEERGVEITRVEDDSPAAKAGLKEGDVVLEYNGLRVEGTEQFVRLVRETPAGRTVKLLIHREDATQTVTATIGQRQSRAYRWEGDVRKEMEKLQESLKGLREFRVEMPDIPRAMMSWRSAMLGVEAEGLSAQLAEFFGVKEGVLVRAVVKDSAAEKAGIKAGDVITKVDNEKVSTPGEVTGAIRSARAKKKTIPVTVVRNRQETTLNVTIEEPEPRPAPSPRPRRIQTPRTERQFAPPLRVRALESIPL